MKSSFFYEANPFTKLLLCFLIAFFCFILTFIVSVILAMPIFGIGPNELISALEDLNNIDNLNLLKYLQIAQSAGLFLIPPFILGYMFSGSSFSYLKLKQAPLLVPSVITFLLLLSSLPVINLLNEINQTLHLPEWLAGVESWMKRSEEAAEKLTESFLKVHTIEGLLLNLIMIAVIPALGEELLFRGVLQRIFIEWTKNIHLGIFIAAFIFSAFHFQFYGFLPRMMLGVLFGYLFVFGGSIWYPIIAHFINNAMAVLVYFFIGKEGVEESIDQFGVRGNSVIFVLVGVIFLILLLHFFKAKFKNS